MSISRALVLSGGESRRMGRAKASLLYDGVPQYQRVHDVLAACFDQVFFSVPAQARLNKDFADIVNTFSCVYDVEQIQCCPMLGIYSALEHRHSAWFVVAVDMPNLSRSGIEAFLRQRDSLHAEKGCNAYVARTAGKDFPDPLFAVYEPSAHVFLRRALRDGRYSLQALLREPDFAVSEIHVDACEIININTMDEYQQYTQKNQD